MNKITYGTIRRLKESGEIEVRVYDSEDAYKNDNYYVAEVLDKGVNVDEYCEGVVDKFENPYYVELVDNKGKVVGHTSGVDEDGNFLVEGVKKNHTEEYWDATEIARDLFVSLLRFDFGYDYRGNNYIITIDNYEAERFRANSDEEAKEIYKNWKEARDSGAVEYDFNNNYKKIVESKIEGIEDKDLNEYKKFVDKQLRDGAIDDPEYVKTLSKEEYETLLVDTWMKDKDLIDMFREQKYKEDEILETEDTELWVNGKLYWSGDGRDVDYNLLLDVADQATEEDGVPYDHEDVEVVKIEESLKEAEAEKRDDVDIEKLAHYIMSGVEMFEELSQDDSDIFAGTQDSYATEVFEQNLYDELLYSGLFQIEDLAQEIDHPSADGKKLDELYNGIIDIVEGGKGFETVKDIENYIRAIVEDNPKPSKKTVKEEIDNTKQRFIDYCKGKIKNLGSVKINSEDVDGITYISDDEEPQTYKIKVDYISEDDVKALNPVDTLDAFELENTYLYPDGRVFDGGEMDAGHIAHLAELDFKAIDKSFYQEVLDNWEDWELPSWFEVADEHKDRAVNESKGMEGIWGAVCGTETPGRKAFIDKYFTNHKPNRRYHRFDADNSLIMGALRNRNYNTVKQLMSYGETVLDDEKDEFDRLMKKQEVKEAVNPNAGYIDFLKQNLGDTYKEEETDKYLIIRGMKDGKPIGALWYGRASKPQIYATFRSEEEREEYIKRFLNNKASDEEAKAKRRVEQKLTKDHNFKVGDIFYTSWGYDQTNIDFYEVVNVRGSRLDLRELRKETVGQSGTYDEVKPIPGDYASDKIITISARADGSVTRMSSFEYPSLWDGRPKHETNSYFGH